MESSINKGLASQLRAMREARNWSQEELAALVDMPQTAISRLESPSYGKQTITTLKRMARAYDVGLDVRFVPFSLLADRMSKTPRVDLGLTSDAVDVPSFEEEMEQGAFDRNAATVRAAIPATVPTPLVQEGRWVANATKISFLVRPQGNVDEVPMTQESNWSHYKVDVLPPMQELQYPPQMNEQVNSLQYYFRRPEATPVPVKKRPEFDYCGMNQAPIAGSEARP